MSSRQIITVLAILLLPPASQADGRMPTTMPTPSIAQSVWVSTDGWPNSLTLATFASDVLRLSGAKTGQDKAIAMWHWSRRLMRTGPTLSEGARGREKQSHDPLKILNISSQGDCMVHGNFASDLAGELEWGRYDIVHGMLPVPGVNVYQLRSGTVPAQREANRRRRSKTKRLWRGLTENMNRRQVLTGRKIVAGTRNHRNRHAAVFARTIQRIAKPIPLRIVERILFFGAVESD